MISYKLHCHQSHEFESWFSSSANFDRQQEAGLLSCPVCGSTQIQKSLMAPAVSTSRKKRDALAKVEGKEQQDFGSQPAQNASSGVAMAPPIPAELIEQVREFKRRIVANSEDVGDRFVEEARKIHYGEVEQKSIVGRASMQDAAQLQEEGIEVLPLPELPEDKN